MAKQPKHTVSHLLKGIMATAPYAHNVDQAKSGETAYATSFGALKFNFGYAATVDADSPTLMTKKKQGKQCRKLKQLIPSH